MSTDYPGREQEHDLGEQRSFLWLYGYDDDLIGLIEHHPPSPQDAANGSVYCGGYLAWNTPPDGTHMKLSGHTLVSGGPGDEASLTISPSVLCRRCGNHGWIQNGRWVNA